METLDIIKESFIFPSRNLKKLAVYIALTVVAGFLMIGGVFFFMFALNESIAYLLVTMLLFLLAFAVGLIISGYQIGIMKSGIDQVGEAPSLDWKNNIITGLKMVIVAIVYFVIPAVIVGIVAVATNLLENFSAVYQEMNTNAVYYTGPAISSVSYSTLNAFYSSLIITVLVGVILFIIFTVIETMGAARLANTDRLSDAIDIPEAIGDIKRIGIGKVIAVILLVFIIVAVIQTILNTIIGNVPQLSILSIFVTPYLAFFTQRASGLMYSDIA